MLKGAGHNKFWGSFKHGSLKFNLAILKGGRKKVPPFERGARKVLPYLEGACKGFRTCDFPILLTPSSP